MGQMDQTSEGTTTLAFLQCELLHYDACFPVQQASILAKEATDRQVSPTDMPTADHHDAKENGTPSPLTVQDSPLQAPSTYAQD
jgi:hypothetical protein